MNLATDNLLGAMVGFFDQGLLVIEDLASSSSHNGWDARTEYVHFDHDSIYVAVQSVVDGPVSVSVYGSQVGEEEIVDMVEAFSGEVSLVHGRLKTHDPDDTLVLITRHGNDVVRLRVLFDRPNWASRVVVIVEN
jgi:hypothetical protein